MTNLSKLNISELKAFLDSFDNVLCDCDGVLWLYGVPFPNANKSVFTLQKLGKRVGVVTNNTLRKHKDLHQFLKGMGFDIALEDITYPTLAIVDYLKSINFQKEVFVMGWPAMEEEIAEAGFKVAEINDHVTKVTAENLRNLVVDNENVGAVVADYDVNLTYVKFAKAALYLRRSDVLYMSGARDDLIPISPGESIMGPCGLQDTLQNCSRKQQIVLGKPGAEFNKFILKKLGIKDPSRTLFIGDSLIHDIKFGKTHGYQTLLVLTGISSLEDAQYCPVEMTPDYYVNSFADIHTIIAEKLKL